MKEKNNSNKNESLENEIKNNPNEKIDNDKNNPKRYII